LLVDADAPPDQFDEEIFPVVTGANLIPAQTITPDMFSRLNTRQEGRSNPEPCDNPFYIEQIRSGKPGFLPRKTF